MGGADLEGPCLRSCCRDIWQGLIGDRLVLLDFDKGGQSLRVVLVVLEEFGLLFVRVVLVEKPVHILAASIPLLQLLLKLLLLLLHLLLLGLLLLLLEELGLLCSPLELLSKFLLLYLTFFLLFHSHTALLNLLLSQPGGLDHFFLLSLLFVQLSFIYLVFQIFCLFLGFLQDSVQVQKHQEEGWEAWLGT